MRRWLCGLLCLLFLAAGSAAADTLPVLKLHQMYAGTADDYILMAGDTVILVDCGSNVTEWVYPTTLVDYLDALGIDHVDHYFVTHYHNDHAINIRTLMQRYGTDRTILYGPSPRLDEQFRPLPNGHYRQLTDGQTLSFGDFEIICLWPVRTDASGLYNSHSLNFILKYGDVSIYFTGDYVHSSTAQRYGELLGTVDILKFPHHGLQDFAINQRTLACMRPSVVLFSSYYPSGTQAYLRKAGITDARSLMGKEGNIVVLTDGEGIEVFTQVTPGSFGVDYQAPLGTEPEAEVIRRSN